MKKQETRDNGRSFYFPPAGAPYPNGSKTAAVIHYFGGYIAYSTEYGDYLGEPRPLTPFKRWHVEEVLTGHERKYYKRRTAINKGFDPHVGRNVVEFPIEGEWQHEDVPVYERIKTDDTPDFHAFGRRVTVGDVVTSQVGAGRAFEGEQVLEEVTDHYYKVKGIYIPWSQGGTLAKV